MPDANINIPPELAEQIHARARAMGMDVPTYLQFLENCRERRHDHAFQRAVRQMFLKYPATLRKLAQ